MHQSYAWAMPFVDPFTVTASICTTTNTNTIVPQHGMAKLLHGVFIVSANEQLKDANFFSKLYKLILK